MSVNTLTTVKQVAIMNGFTSHVHGSRLTANGSSFASGSLSHHLSCNANAKGNHVAQPP